MHYCYCFALPEQFVANVHEADRAFCIQHVVSSTLMLTSANGLSTSRLTITRIMSPIESWRRGVFAPIDRRECPEDVQIQLVGDEAH